MYDTILYNVTERTATITLNRPEAGNAFAKESYLEVRDAFIRAGEDDSVRAVVITGSGKHFSAGGDINRFKSLIQSGEYLRKENVTAAGRMSAAVRECPKPVVAIINGAAAGAGCSLALACDFRVVSAESKLVMAFVKMGLSGDTGGLYYLQKLVGMAKAAEIMMTGAPITGEEALRLGLATVIAEKDSLLADGYALAAKLAESPTFAISRQKELINEIFYADYAAYSEREAEYMVACSHTADFAEAVDAFLEKRPPRFSGK